MNRFPKMAVLQRFRAEKLGYSSKLAKAIGIAEATKYAIFKNFALSKRENIEKKLIKTGKVGSSEEFSRMQFDENFKIHFENWWPFVWGKVFKDVDYDLYFSRFDKNVINKLEDWAKSIVDKINLDTLKNEQKFFKQVWIPHRDDEI